MNTPCIIVNMTGPLLGDSFGNERTMLHTRSRNSAPL